MNKKETCLQLAKRKQKMSVFSKKRGVMDDVLFNQACCALHMLCCRGPDDPVLLRPFFEHIGKHSTFLFKWDMHLRGAALNGKPKLLRALLDLETNLQSDVLFPRPENKDCFRILIDAGIIPFKQPNYPSWTSVSL